jgi:sialidase-1
MNRLLTRTLICILSANTALSAGSFEDAPEGAFGTIDTTIGQWSAPANNAAVLRGKARTGAKSLRLHGEGEVAAVLTLREVAREGSGISFHAERWTRRGPFRFRVDAGSANGGWREIYNGDEAVRVGGYHAHIDLDLPAGTNRVRFRCEAPADGGVLLDDFRVEAPGPATVSGLEIVQPVAPAFVRESFNPVLGFKVTVAGRLGDVALEAFDIGLDGTTNLEDITAVRIIRGTANPAHRSTEVISQSDRIAARMTLTSDTRLAAGEHWFWVSPEFREGADIDGRVNAALHRVKSGQGIHEAQNPSPGSPQRIGYAVRLPGDDGSVSYRIPGLVESTKGTLVAVYDIRYRHSGDLPADVDVGVSRSTDGGRTWGPMIVAMNMGNDPRHSYDGIGDPAILVDPSNGRLWISALWSHGNNAWNGSGPGMKPSETGQFMLAYSDDDGVTWSESINVTSQMKDPEWRLFFNGPGAGIVLADGKLVFPAQFRDSSGMPWSTIIWSADHGNTWTVGSGVKSNTTEAQVVQLADGSIMINSRDNRGGSRTVATTDDLGQTWTPHPTDRSALPESVCMASLMAWDHPRHGRFLTFSNPNTRSGRHSMTLKVSTDEGMTWPESRHLLYDSRDCYGYSCLATVGDSHVGVLYEGRDTMYFLRFPVDELLD